MKRKISVITLAAMLVGIIAGCLTVINGMAGGSPADTVYLEAGEQYTKIMGFEPGDAGTLQYGTNSSAGNTVVQTAVRNNGDKALKVHFTDGSDSGFINPNIQFTTDISGATYVQFWIQNSTDVPVQFFFTGFMNGPQTDASLTPANIYQIN